MSNEPKTGRQRKNVKVIAAIIGIAAIICAVTIPEIRIIIGLDPPIVKPVARLPAETEIPLNINRLLIDDPIGAESYWDGDSVIIYYSYRNGNGQIMINGVKYSFDRIDVNESDHSRILSGPKVVVRTSKMLYDEESGGDCNYGNFAKTSITFKGNIYTIKDLMLQHCPEEFSN